MPSARIDLPLALLIFRTLTLGAQHGWAIAERVQQISSDVVRIQHESLYPASARG
jgi:PadR family transcriptional regulator PadR